MSGETEPQKGNVSRREFIKIGVSAVGGAVLAGVGTYAFMQQSVSSKENTINQLQQQLTQAQSTAQQLQSQIAQEQGFIILNSSEQSLLESIAETIIPSDSNGPGAKEAGVIYFIDRQLAGDYGKNAQMYMKGPFVRAGQSGPITVDGITYPAGTPNVRVGAGTRYQYTLQMREFWRLGLQHLQEYANSAYGNNFEKLSDQQKQQVLKDLWNNKPTNFGDILPQDFAYELFFMVWAGFLMDPMYGGNKNMVGWIYTGFSGANDGNFFGEGYTMQQIMTSKTPIRLKPVSLAMFQQKLLYGSTSSSTSPSG